MVHVSRKWMMHDCTMSLSVFLMKFNNKKLRTEYSSSTTNINLCERKKLMMTTWFIQMEFRMSTSLSIQNAKQTGWTDLMRSRCYVWIRCDDPVEHKYTRHRLRLVVFHRHSSATKEFNFDTLKVEKFQLVNEGPHDWKWIRWRTVQCHLGFFFNIKFNEKKIQTKLNNNY